MTFIKGSAGVGAAMLIGLSAPSAQAGYVVDLTQVGSDVVATGSGPIDLTGLTFSGNTSVSSLVAPDAAIINTGTNSAVEDTYTGATGPASFGSGFLASFANSAAGDMVGIMGPGGEVIVPFGYVSDSPLSDTATYDGQTFMSLGVTPGRYEWTWGSGANQNFTLVVGTVVPEHSTWAMMLIGFAGLGFMGYQSAGQRRGTARNT
jgi:hypothetical protein